jgi:hypothetical protein
MNGYEQQERTSILGFVHKQPPRLQQNRHSERCDVMPHLNVAEELILNPDCPLEQAFLTHAIRSMSVMAI